MFHIPFQSSQSQSRSDDKTELTLFRNRTEEEERPRWVGGYIHIKGRLASILLSLSQISVYVRLPKSDIDTPLSFLCAFEYTLKDRYQHIYSTSCSDLTLCMLYYMEIRSLAWSACCSAVSGRELSVYVYMDNAYMHERTVPLIYMHAHTVIYCKLLYY